MTRFTVITPTLLRESLMQTCASLDQQSFRDWQHVIAVDVETDSSTVLPWTDERRELLLCGKRYANFGNTPRFLAWEKAKGEYLIHLDDDNVLADRKVLEDIDRALFRAGEPQWALFPILRHGQRFFTDPPRSCHADTLNIVVKREIGRWPNIPDYTADGIWIDGLVRDHSYVAFPQFRPIGIMASSRQGQ